jgi:hypothetical protein
LCKIDKKRVNKNGCFLKAGAKIAGSVKKKPAQQVFYRNNVS